MDYYLVFLWNLVDPQVIGPFSTTEERDNEAVKYRKQHGDVHGYFSVEVTKGAKFHVDCFSSDLFDD